MESSPNNIPDWAKENQKHFQSELNGFGRFPEEFYDSILLQINQAGIVADLGCGNGMLIKFIMDFSKFEIVPFGIDLSATCIDYAKQITLPEFASNFVNANLKNYAFPRSHFNIVIICPTYVNAQHMQTIFDSLKSGGRMIILIHEDNMRRNNVVTMAQLPWIKDMGARLVRHNHFEVGTIDKP